MSSFVVYLHGLVSRHIVRLFFTVLSHFSHSELKENGVHQISCSRIPTSYLSCNIGDRLSRIVHPAAAVTVNKCISHTHGRNVCWLLTSAASGDSLRVYRRERQMDRHQSDALHFPLRTQPVYVSVLQSDSLCICWASTGYLNKLLPQGGKRDDVPPPIAVRLAADLRPSADGSAVSTRIRCRQPTCL